MNLTSFTGRDASTVISTNTTATAAPIHPLNPSGKTIAGALFLFLAIMMAAGFWLPGGLNFVLTLIAMIGFALVLGRGIVSRAFGILINENNVMSLSRFQIVSWTLVILSSYVCYALVRVHNGVPNPLQIQFDSQLLLAMGISTTSFVAAPVILGTKKDKEPGPSVTVKTASKTGESVETVDANREGTIYANSSAADARFTDIFQGDEVGNTTHIDVAKLQMFFFTLMGVVAYAAAVFQQLTTTDGPSSALSALPALPSGLIISLAVSHAGYLSSKGIDHTPTQH